MVHIVKNNKGTLGILIIGFIVLITTLLIFFTAGSTHDLIDWLSLVFIIVAEFSVTGGLIAVNHYSEQTFGIMLRAGAYSLFVLYFIAATVVSTVFLAGILNSTGLLVTIQLIIIAIAAIIMILLVNSSNYVAEKNRDADEAISVFQQMENSLILLKSDSRNRQYASKIEKIYETIRFSDKSCYLDSDEIIAEKITELEMSLTEGSSKNDEEIKAVLEELLLLTKKRSLEVSGIKTGGI